MSIIIRIYSKNNELMEKRGMNRRVVKGIYIHTVN